VSDARAQIIASVRNSLGRGRLDAHADAELRARVAARRRNLVPARATALEEGARVELFVAMAEEVQATVTRVTSLAGVPEAVARYLAEENLPAELVVAPDPSLDAIPWNAWPLLRIRSGRAEPEDRASLTPCHAAIAETGTLMLISSAQTPTTLNFLPETHIVLVHGDQDTMIPFEAMFAAANEFAAAEIPSQWHLSMGVGHGIDAGALRHGGLFLAKAFGVAVR